MTAASITAEPTGPTGDPPRAAEREELEELRSRVAAQQRLIEAMLDENADIHELRRRNHELEQYMGRLLAFAPVRAAIKIRRRILHRPEAAS